ncbi:MEKHLA domain-containing protein [Croceicoccus ponticola]|uniref:MEKHLA domain-containing protein n=1 Tax=Croceicoccus ponticola TaxID=2217664 RepID=A0A437GY92_9SPHN|nr:MEKHLA domain-containing protein [Croceicoccus ponticola]RVQ66436.1 MEKHLA domain-containing protein [Croceicoccus ponticola]
MPDRDLIERHARPERIALIAQSHAALTGKALVARCDGDVADALWHLPAVVLAHGIEDDPVFFYANRAALDRFALTGRALMAMPSRLSAEAPERGERDRLLARVGANGFIDDYSGVRIAATGQRFRIGRATVWNLIDAAGHRHGQAATFAEWTDL